MSIEKKNKYPFDTLDTTTIWDPTELIAYHTYRREESKKMKRKKQEQKEVTIIKSYLRENTNKKQEVGKCL